MNNWNKFLSMEANYLEEPEQSIARVSVTNGCYIDVCVPRTNKEKIKILLDLLSDWNPFHKYLKEYETFSDEYIERFSDEVFNDLTDAINESIDESQCATWINGGDFVITDCEE